MKKFSSIESFRHVVKYVKVKHHSLPVYTFTGTTKLHGSNLGVRYHNGKYKCQSRNNLIDTTCDVYGFANFIENLPSDYREALFNMVSNEYNTKEFTLYGEWIGPGIQSKVAVADLPSKQWVLFGVWNHETESYEEILPNIHFRGQNIFNISDIPQYTTEIDFNNPQDVIDKLEELTLAVEDQCPWAKQFGVEGIGEGIVWKCDQDPSNSELWFKTKGNKHKRGKDDKQRKIATVDPEVVKKYEELVNILVSEDRLRQGLEYLKEQQLDVDIRNMGQFLKWIGNDIRKEESDTIEASGFEWKHLGKHINNKAKKFFKEETNKW